MLHPIRHFYSAATNEFHEFRKTFVERATRAFWVPDEVTDAEGGEVFAFIPGSKPGQGSVALILPDPVSNAARIGRREIDSRQGGDHRSQEKKRRQEGRSPGSAPGTPT